MTTISSLRQLTSNLPAVLGRIAKEPLVKRESDHYLAAIGQVKSLNDFMSNDRVYRFALKAFGLEEMAYGKAFIRRLLSEGIDRRDSLANKLADPRFRELATAFNFARYGSTTTTFQRTQQGTVDLYLRQTLETNAGGTNDGVRLALYFQRKASSITTPYSLLADRALLKVTQVALGLPESSSVLDIDRQADLIAKRIDVTEFKDAARLEKFLGRFAALWDVNQSAPATSSGVTLITGPSGAAFGTDLLEQLQRVRKGG